MVNFVGDSFAAVFSDSAAGMRAAVAICRGVQQRNQPLRRTRRMYFRMGLDAGEVVVADDGRYFGEPLNIAARIQAIAEVGGINVTKAVYQDLDEPALRLISLGRRHLKNIPEPVHVYRLASTASVTTITTGPSEHAVTTGVVRSGARPRRALHEAAKNRINVALGPESRTAPDTVASQRPMERSQGSA